jgi:tetratricopeptide (TPR) repeat protein
MANLSFAIADRGALADAELMSRRAVELARRHLAPTASERRQAILNHAVILDRSKRLDEAEALYREVLAIERASADDRGVVIVQSNLGHLLSRQKRDDEATATLTECVAHARSTIGADHPAALSAMRNLGALMQRRKLAGAAELMREVVERSQRVLGPGHRDTIARTRDLVLCLMSEGRSDEAEPLARACLATSQAQLGPLADVTAGLHEVLVACIGLDGRLDEAIGIAKAWYDSLLASAGPDHAVTRRAARLIAECYATKGDAAQEAHWRSVADAPGAG